MTKRETRNPAKTKPAAKVRQRRGGYATLLAKLRAKRDKMADEIVALGNAIDALEVLE